MDRLKRFQPNLPLRVGARVRIVVGMFEGYEGEIIEVDLERRQVRFKIAVFNRSVELVDDLEASLLELV